MFKRVWSKWLVLRNLDSKHGIKLDYTRLTKLWFNTKAPSETWDRAATNKPLGWNESGSDKSSCFCLVKLLFFIFSHDFSHAKNRQLSRISACPRPVLLGLRRLLSYFSPWSQSKYNVYQCLVVQKHSKTPPEKTRKLWNTMIRYDW